MKTHAKLSIAILILVFMFSCTGFVKEFQFMGKLKDTLSKRYQTGNISLKILNHENLTVSFVNTRFDTLQPEAKQKMAYEIGEIILKTNPKENNIQSGRLVFVRENNYVVASMSNSYSYDMRLDSIATQVHRTDTVHTP